MKLLVVLLSFFSVCHGEMFTSIAGMEKLLLTERTLLGLLEYFIVVEGKRESSLEDLCLVMKQELEVAMEDTEKYLNNPINTYLLIKRLVLDWKVIEERMSGSLAGEILAQMESALQLPTNDDLAGAVTALIRLQNTYGLEPSSMANGVLNGTKYSSELQATDCFEVGKALHKNEDYENAALWMSEALQKYETDRNVRLIPKWKILEYLAFSTFVQGDVVKAYNHTKELLAINPYHRRSLDNKVYYEDAIQRNTLNDPSNPNPSDYYSQACLGVVSPPPAYAAKLKCRYTHKNNPFLLLGPLKEEEFFLDPQIVLYHEILTEDEIEVIKNISQTKMELVDDEENESSSNSMKVRFANDEHPILEAVLKKAEYVTGLTTSTAESFQVTNYGIVGHSNLHYDFFEQNDTVGSDDRIATLLFYLSNVEQGGATVFPSLNVTLWPQKGSVAMWYNLYPSGYQDFHTKHAGCPVIAGSKWIATQWFRMAGQEFRRPCRMRPDYVQGPRDG